MEIQSKKKISYHESTYIANYLEYFYLTRKLFNKSNIEIIDNIVCFNRQFNLLSYYLKEIVRLTLHIHILKITELYIKIDIFYHSGS